jgi:hypothetical protein
VGLGAILVQGAWSPDVPYLWRISSLVIFGITVLAVSALIGLVLGTPLYRVAVALGVVSSLTLGGSILLLVGPTMVLVATGAASGVLAVAFGAAAMWTGRTTPVGLDPA